MRSWLTLAILGGLLGCDGGRQVPVGGPTGAGRPDVGEGRDGAEVDVGVGADGGSSDGGGLDAAPAQDAPVGDGTALDGGVSFDGGAPDAATVDGGMLDAGPGTITGYIGVSQVLRASADLTTATAGFYTLASVRPCSESVDGPCRIYECPTASSQPTPLDGGRLTARVGATTLTSAFSAANGYYQPASVQARSWSGGETIAIDLAGSALIPGFSTTLVAPAQQILTAPVVPPLGMPLVIGRGALALAWQSRGTGSAVFGFGATRGSTSFSASCSFAVGSGGGVIPASVVARLPTTGGTFQAYAHVVEQRRSGAADLTVQSTVNMASPSGLDAVGLLEVR